MLPTQLDIKMLDIRGRIKIIRNVNISRQKKFLILQRSLKPLKWGIFLGFSWNFLDKIQNVKILKNFIPLKISHF
jgi:hypothetical protein